MYDSKYDSKMHDITIPLMGFNGFHHAGNKDNFEHFIGRESILDKLKSWLVDSSNNNYSGAYLITGFRGMGKSAFVHKAIKDIQAEKDQNNCHYVPIPINVGNDMLTSKELLYIICKLLSAKFDEETRLINSDAKKKWKWDILGLSRWQKQGFASKINIVIGRIVSLILAVFFLLKGISTQSLSNSDTILVRSEIKSMTSTISDLNIHLGNIESSLIYLIAGFCFLVAFFLMHRLYNRIWNLTGSQFFITSWQIKKTFKHLNERIDSEMIESNEFGIDSSKNSKPFDVVPGLRFLKNKKNVYPIAQTTEIQDLLVKQLSLIKKLSHANIRIIFIIDELDKVSPEDNEKQTVPEYNSANVMNGNSTYNSRQKAFVGLLANMKYFISSSEAKFIFITGYDMYEATLADISNREFNLHSIFNGYINVSSFLRKTGKNKGADSMMEKYFCQFLIKKDEKNKEDLRDYVDFVKSYWESLSKETTARYEMLLERQIIFLRHYLTYLFYMSNGSPKKLAIYLEKYIRSKALIEQRLEADFKTSGTEQNSEVDDIMLGITEGCEWFLYFDERNIQKIEFVAYLIYPMLKNLIAKSSIYNDKLLISTSFMISNLYKFHKSGFSWRNLEYMPELLDINKTPELRDFIGGIMQFLNQTHIDEVVANLYKFEFPLRLSEEITYFSKTAEELSYLFNFSHDELLSIKKLYNEQLQHYSKSSYESPALASIHHMMGDIYMLEENYEQAIFEYNEALNAISRQLKTNDKEDATSDDVLFTIRVMLKLGLAYEKRKTFDTAYITYGNLVDKVYDIAEKARISQKCHDNQKKYKLTTVLSTIHDNYSDFFTNIHLIFLGILSKIAVIEKMDLGGISEHDLYSLLHEFMTIEKVLNGEDDGKDEDIEKDEDKYHNTKTIRLVLLTDFYTKLGDILFYKNGIVQSKKYEKNKDCPNCYSDVLECLRRELELGGILDDKFGKCLDFLNGKDKSLDCNRTTQYRINAPCIACQCFNKSIKICLEELNEDIKQFEKDSRSLFFLRQLLDEDSNQEIVKKGNVFMMAMSNALVGMGNTLLGCIKTTDGFSIEKFFSALYELFKNGFAEPDVKRLDAIISLNINHFAKSLLYYLAAAKTYELLTDYKSAYNIYIQILDAIRVRHQVEIVESSNSELPEETLAFCKKVTQRAIECTFLHYDSINCSEIETQKYEMSKKPIDSVNLYALSSFPEIEVVIEKYFHLCLLGNLKKRNYVLQTVLNSRQLGTYKLIATLTQNIQNLYFKVIVNEEILSRVIPKLSQSLKDDDHNLAQTLSYIKDYYCSCDACDFICDMKWELLDGIPEQQKRFYLLDYLIKDSRYCLNKIIDLISPLYSTTLYNNAFIGEIYEKAYKWNHILNCLRELYEYMKSEKDFIDGFNKRYPPQRRSQQFNKIEDILVECKFFLKNEAHIDHQTFDVNGIYSIINSDANNFQTNSYLMGNAIDYYSRAIEMHTSGKTYKEMITTLFFLEDDLHNDSNYMNLATERFLLNNNYVQDKLNRLKKYSFQNTSLLRIRNYVK